MDNQPNNDEILREVIRRKDVLIKELHRKITEKTEEHRAWERLMNGTPKGTRPMGVYLHKETIVVTGDPVNEDECDHSCDAMGCTSVSHVLWRGSYEEFCKMCCKATDEEIGGKTIAPPEPPPDPPPLILKEGRLCPREEE
jgi:hypothetical protein